MTGQAATAARTAPPRRSDVEQRAAQAAQLFRAGRPREVAQLCETILAAVPAHPEALLFLGLVRAQEGQFGEAINRLIAANHARPDWLEAIANLGNVFANMGHHERALEQYRRALALRPDHAGVMCNLANSLTALGRHDEAIAQYRAAIALRWDHAEAHANLGLLLMELGRGAEARAALERAIDIAPRRVSFYRKLVDTKKFAPGDRHLEAMLGLAKNLQAMHPMERIELHFALGKALADAGDHRGAFENLLAGNRLKRGQTAYDEAATQRYFAGVEQAFDASRVAAQRGGGDPSEAPVFIVGMPRSGTTLVEQILSRHPAVHAAGELPEFETAVAGTGGRDGQPIRYPDDVPALGSDQLRQIGARYARRVTALAPEAARIIDKMPANFRYVGLIHLALPNARIIHTRRDPMDTCLSCFSKLFMGHLPFAYDLGELGRYWRAYDGLMDHWRRVLPAEVMIEVHYETLVDNLEQEARRIVAHCGLPWDDACLDFHEGRRRVHTASATQVTQPIYATSIGRWLPYKDYLGPLFAGLQIDVDRV